MQTSDLFGVQRYGGIAPSKADIRMMKFCFGKFTDAAHKREGIVRVLHRIGRRLSVPDIGLNGSEPWVIGPEQRPALIRVPRRNPHDRPLRMHAPNNTPAEE